jgi:hypothetical protein
VLGRIFVGEGRFINVEENFVARAKFFYVEGSSLLGEGCVLDREGRIT